MMDQNASAAASWLAKFPEPSQRVVASWFAYVISKGTTDPEGIVAKVTIFCGLKQQWAVTPATRQLVNLTRQALEDDPGGALGYAAKILQEGPP